MFERILFPTDFSDSGKKILKCVGEIPGIKDIIILHIIDPERFVYGEKSEDELVKKAETMLNEQKGYLTSIAKKVKTEVRVGIPSREILRTAEKEKVSLVVMGARGMSLIKDILLGSVSSDVLRYGKTHLLIMRQKFAGELEGDVLEKHCKLIFSKVLYPTDFSKNSERALSLLDQISNIGKITLVHAIDRGETREELDALNKEAEEKLERLRENLKKRGIEAQYHIHIGAPVNVINGVADEEDISLIAIGTKGKGLIEELRIGSTAESVVRSAKTPVLILRA